MAERTQPSAATGTLVLLVLITVAIGVTSLRLSPAALGYYHWLRAIAGTVLLIWLVRKSLASPPVPESGWTLLVTGAVLLKVVSDWHSLLLD